MLEIFENEPLMHVTISTVHEKLDTEVYGHSFPRKTDETEIKHIYFFLCYVSSKIFINVMVNIYFLMDIQQYFSIIIFIKNH